MAHNVTKISDTTSIRDAEKNCFYNGQSDKKSLKSLKWKILEQDERMVQTLAQKVSGSEVLFRILINRGISSVQEATSFLDPKLRDLLPNPFLLQDMEKGVNRIIEALNKKEQITIFADYDVDGATSSALLYKFFKSLGLITNIYIPCRLTEGYGPNVEAIKKLKQNGCNLLITVDCGTSSFEPLEVAKNLGLDVIVIDHHLAPTELPQAHSIINPNRLDDDFPHKALAAVGVAFFVAIAIRQRLREAKWFAQNDIIEPDLMQLLDLVALGTVCDVMPLTGINRPFVKHGLNLIAKRKNIGLMTLFDMAKIDSKPESYHLGFVVGPRINAGGRVNHSGLGAELLTTESASDAFKIAEKLEKLNNERKDIERRALEEAIEYIRISKAENDPIIFAVGNEWHIGILGILASRIKEKYHKPCAIISIKDGICKGSARSIAGIDLGSKIAKAKLKGLILDGGGHAMAGGFTMDEAKIDEFKHYIINSINDLSDGDNIYQKASELYIDATITVNGANLGLLKDIEKAAPFGNANPIPKFAIYGATVVKVTVVGDNNLMLLITECNNRMGNNKILKCILFRAMDQEIGHMLLNHVGKNVDLVGQLHHNNGWGKHSVKMIIEDIVLLDD